MGACDALLTTPAQIEDQLATGLIGPMNVTPAVLPVMRSQRSGHIMSISSGAGLWIRGRILSCK
jgi:NAD(P)-dependent dehydrogenase (short-subunit alcohol dehydrogenase family)